MSLIKCNECMSEISSEADSCPTCGNPVIAESPAINRHVVVDDRSEEGFPKWLVTPLLIVSAIVVFFIIMMVRSSDENDTMANTNIDVDIQRSADQTSDSTRTTDTLTSDPNPASDPGRSIEPEPMTTDSSSTSTTVVTPSSESDAPGADQQKGVVQIDARVQSKTGSIQTVKNEKFYLLDKDFESILSDADLKPIPGQSLSNSFGMAVLYPGKYGDFRRKALEAINNHIKYSVTTDREGKASINGVKPDRYYLFGINKSDTGFAIWDSNVSIREGENKLNLTPIRLNEMPRPAE